MHTPSDAVGFLQRYIDTGIPLTADMGIRVETWDDGGLTLTAPFAPNRNDKNTAFGGSLSALVTLAGWGLTFVFLRDAGICADVMVRRTRIDYDHPVRGDIVARCLMPNEATRQRFLHALHTVGKARWQLTQQVEGNGVPAVLCEGTFVAVARR